MIRTFPNKHARATFAATILIGSAAQATVGPRVEIGMPADTVAAVSGQPYDGVFEVRVFKPGRLADVRLFGESWNVLQLTPPTQELIANAGVVRIPFRAIPTDADKPIGLTCTFEGRRVRKSFGIGPAYFAQAGKPKPAARLPNTSGVRPGAAGGGGEDAPEGGSPLRVVGRIVYTRPDNIVVGADRIDVRVLDDDPIGSEEIWSGFTDENGFFDTGVVNWDDDGDDPDLVVYFETETGGWVDVTDNSILESTFTFESAEVSDFTGSFYDFGWLTPADSSLYPALHIFNTITRTRRFILENPGFAPAEVQVEWPGDNTEYQPDAVEIHVSAEHQWNEDAQAHEYGHHFVHGLYTTPDPDYCLDSSCDPDPPDDCSHCVWCAETDHDAFNEGWPDWLGDVVTRAFVTRYQFDGGLPYQPILSGLLTELEGLAMCGDSNSFENPLMTEGFVAGLLRDMEDAEQDDHNSDGIFDLLCLGPNPGFTVLNNHHPITVTDFINGFLTDLPQHTGRFWSTAFNVGGAAYVPDFPADTQPPGVVPALDSPSHPLGTGGPLPCITFDFDPAPDDARGASVYSYWARPTPQEPDEVPDPIFDGTGCRLQGIAPVLDIGTYYISIKAQDNAGNWSSQWASFGPFQVTDCNGTGLLDVCDIDCNSEGIPGCQIGGLCVGPPGNGCGQSSDCNANFQPDECDIAQGTSQDCNLDGVPDECQPMKHWEGGDSAGPTWWHLAGNWEENAVPTTGDHVCIPAGPPTPLLRQGTYSLADLACYQDLDMIRLPPFSNTTTLAGPSFVLGDLTMGGSTLNVNDELVIHGLFEWGPNSTIGGTGVTRVLGQLSITGSVNLFSNALELECDTFATAGINANQAVVRNFAGYTYEHNGGSISVIDGNSNLFINEGSFVKSAGAGSTRFGVPVNNSGQMRVEQGTLLFQSALTCTGSVLGLPGTTVDFSGGTKDFLPGSSLVGDHVHSFGSTSVNVGGTYDAGVGTTIDSSTFNFLAGANIVDYGENLIVAGAAHFEAVHGATIIFQTMTITGNVFFDSGDPISTGTFTLGPGNGTYRGASQALTINGLFTWEHSADFVDPGVIHANGGLLLQFSSGTRNLPRVLNNAGLATILGGININPGGMINNLATGYMDIQFDGGFLSGSGGGTTILTNAGTLVKSAGTGISSIGTGTAGIHPTSINSGTVEVQSGVLAFSNGNYIQTAGQTILNGGGLAMTGTLGLPVQLNGGILKGAGTVTGSVSNAGGTVQPGLSPGILNISSNYTQASGGALEIELGGLTPGTQYDRLNVTGTAALSGTLKVALIGGFAPVLGQQFVVLTASSVSGTFSAVEALTPGLAVNVLYGPTTVTLEITSVPAMGDCDDDGDADLADYTQFPECLSGPGVPYSSSACECLDSDADGAIDLHDFGAIQTNFTN